MEGTKLHLFLMPSYLGYVGLEPLQSAYPGLEGIKERCNMVPFFFDDFTSSLSLWGRCTNSCVVGLLASKPGGLAWTKATWRCVHMSTKAAEKSVQASSLHAAVTRPCSRHTKATQSCTIRLRPQSLCFHAGYNTQVPPQSLSFYISHTNTPTITHPYAGCRCVPRGHAWKIIPHEDKNGHWRQDKTTTPNFHWPPVLLFLHLRWISSLCMLIAALHDCFKQVTVTLCTGNMYAHCSPAWML